MKRLTYLQIVQLADQLRGQAATAKTLDDFHASGLPFTVPRRTVRELVLQLGLMYVKPAQAAPADTERVRQLESRLDASADLDGRMWRALDARLKALEAAAAPKSDAKPASFRPQYRAL